MTDKRGSLPSTMNKQEPVWSTTDNRKSFFFFLICDGKDTASLVRDGSEAGICFVYDEHEEICSGSDG